MKIIEGLKPYEVMRLHEEEGKRVAIRSLEQDPDTREWTRVSNPVWDWLRVEYAIIDDSRPEIGWDEFDWDFFKQYGGLPVYDTSYSKPQPERTHGTPDHYYTIDESPFYPWFGGECPVPGNVEVEVVIRNGSYSGGAAGDLRWSYGKDADSHRRETQDIIALRLTGRVL